MTAILIWVAVPGAAAVLLYGLRRWPRAVYLAGVITALLLAWLAWQFPIGQPIPIRLWAGIPSARIQPDQTLFGSRFVLGNPDRPALALLYMSLAFWLGGSAAARTHRLFAPLGLAAAALFSAAMAAASVAAAMLMIALAALVCLPVLSPPGEPAGRGAVRFLVYMIAGTCLVLFADASLSAILASVTEAQQAELGPTLLMLALGFALILAVVPFHTWLPMLGEETNPYAAAFVFYLMSLAVSFLALDVLQRYSVSGLSPAIFGVLQYAGLLMVLTGGVGAAFERHLGRILGFGAITAMGMTVLAISLNDQLGRATPVMGIYFAQLVPQSLALGVWGLALTILRTVSPGLSFRAARGVVRSHPLAGAALLLANLSLAGMPLLAGFPPSLSLWAALAETAPRAALLALLGCSGLAVAAMRSLAVLVFEEDVEQAEDSVRQAVSLLVLSGSETRRLEAAATGTPPSPVTAAGEAMASTGAGSLAAGNSALGAAIPGAAAAGSPAGGNGDSGEAGQPPSPMAATEEAVASTGEVRAAAGEIRAAGRGAAEPATPNRLALKLAGGMRRLLGSARTVTARQLEIATRQVQSRLGPGAENDGRDGHGEAEAETGGARWNLGETSAQAVLLGLGIAALLIAGCLPQLYMPTLMNMAMIFAGGAP